MPENVATQLKAIAFERDLERFTEGFIGREWVFEEIDRWLQKENERFFILTGEPGVGKSAIAARLTQLRLDIAAYHFCIAGRSGTIEPNHVLLSLAAQLIDYFPDYAEALANTIKPLRLSVNVEITIETIKDSEVRGVVINNLHTQNPQEALNVVLRRSLAALPNPPQQPVLLLIDSLDEAVTLRGDNNLVTLLAEANDLPLWVRFVFTTRSERRVLRYFERLKPYTLAAESQMNLDDIRQYIENRVGKEKMQARLQSAKVEPQTFVNRLSELSSGNFLYTKILLNDIEAGRQTLDDLSALPQSLDEIYHGFLKRFTVSEWEERYQPILGVLAVAQEPITEVQLAHFTGIGQGKIRQNLGVVRQFLDISDDGHGRKTFSVFHQSLRDYLLNEERNIDFWCEAKEQHQRLVDYYMADDQSWHTKPTSDRYLWHHLAYHLSGASKNSELRALLFNFDWLQAKLDATDVNALIADFNFLANDSDLSLVQSAIRLSAHILAEDKTQLAGQLLGRLLMFELPEIQVMLENVKRWKGASWLRPLAPSLTPPSSPLFYTLQGHTGGIRAVTITPDGQQIISASADHTIKIWDLLRGMELAALKGHTDEVRGLVVLPDGQRLLSSSWDGTLKIWDLQRAVVLCTLEGHTEGISGVGVTPDGKIAISASRDCTRKVWNLESGQLLKTFSIRKGSNEAPVLINGQKIAFNIYNPISEHLAVTLDGQKVISTTAYPTPWNPTLVVWDLLTGQEEFSLSGHQSLIHDLIIMLDGERVISAANDRTIKVWNLKNGEELFTLADSACIESIALLPDGKYLVSASGNNSIKVWDLENRKELSTLGVHHEVRAIAVTPDGRRVISGASDGSLKVWNLDDNLQLPPQPSHATWVDFVSVIPNGQQAISVSKRDGIVKIWDLQSGKEVLTSDHQRPIRAIAALPSEYLALSGSQDGSVRIWDLQSGKEFYTVNIPTPTVYASTPAGAMPLETSLAKLTLAFSITPDRQVAVFGLGLHDSISILKVWHLKHKTELFTLSGHTQQISGVTIIPDEQRIISSSFDGTIRVWELETGRQLFALQSHEEPINKFALTPDNERLISASQDGTLKVWDLQKRTLSLTLEGHADIVWAVAVSPNGQHAISVSEDCTLKVWDLSGGKVIASFSGESPLISCAVALDGVTIIAGEKSGQVHLLRWEECEAEFNDSSF
ncbi:AAA family ATPase [Microcoleus sp. T3_A4]|uniref:AAA family ATPase n=1 Tax=Microcoleus sp. T3_A4 TaxID=2818968 RepID=UPI002FD3C562